MLLHKESHREFIYTGDMLPDLDERQYAEFLLHIQKGVLLSLEQRKLLNPSQRECCMTRLEDRYRQKEDGKPQTEPFHAKSFQTEPFHAKSFSAEPFQAEPSGEEAFGE